MSQLGFYSWIRDGVKRAVLLGVSDAVEQLGVPDQEGTVGQQLLAVLRGANETPVAQVMEDKRRAPQAAERKRLGRSLDQIVQSSQKGDDT